MSIETLMQQAGLKAFAYLREHHLFTDSQKHKILILCGPGHNGGDGFVLAQKLLENKFTVEVVVIMPPGKTELKPLTEKMRAQFKGKVHQHDTFDFHLNYGDIVIDSMFGTGLSRPLDESIASIFALLNKQPHYRFALDMPSGIDATLGTPWCETPFKADETLTFSFKKLGQVLLPGKNYCGKVVTLDIGFEKADYETLTDVFYENHPNVWQKRLPYPEAGDHKYTRGYAIVHAGKMSGAGQLAALAALRAGAGIVKIVCPQEHEERFHALSPSLLLEPIRDTFSFKTLIEEQRVSAVLLGPGNGKTGQVRERILHTLMLAKPCVIDADGLTLFEDNVELLIEHIKKSTAPTVLTPHEGEWRCLFSKLIDPNLNKIERALKTAQLTQATVLLKGADSVIASPKGACLVNTNAPPTLATAGSGDVLAGIICGLLSTGLNGFLAASQGVWLHGHAATTLGLGMIADDLVHQGIPQALHDAFQWGY